MAEREAGTDQQAVESRRDFLKTATLSAGLGAAAFGTEQVVAGSPIERGGRSADWGSAAAEVKDLRSGDGWTLPVASDNHESAQVSYRDGRVTISLAGADEFQLADQVQIQVDGILVETPAARTVENRPPNDGHLLNRHSDQAPLVVETWELPIAKNTMIEIYRPSSETVTAFRVIADAPGAEQGAAVA